MFRLSKPENRGRRSCGLTAGKITENHRRYKNFIYTGPHRQNGQSIRRPLEEQLSQSRSHLGCHSRDGVVALSKEAEKPPSGALKIVNIAVLRQPLSESFVSVSVSLSLSLSRLLPISALREVIKRESYIL